MATRRSTSRWHHRRAERHRPRHCRADGDQRHRCSDPALRAITIPRTLADTNEEAANSQALSTCQSIALSAPSLVNQSQPSVLQLLRWPGFGGNNQNGGGYPAVSLSGDGAETSPFARSPTQSVTAANQF
jgi:hypothetical protein